MAMNDLLELSQVVGTLLRQRQETIAIAESCTGGMIANVLTDIPGASQYFDRAVVAYSNESKRDLLGVQEATIRKFGAVSAETAQEMAQGVRRISRTTYGFGISGIAGPGGCSEEKPVGTVYIALATPVKTEVKHFCFHRDRLEFKRMVTATALDWLHRELAPK